MSEILDDIAKFDEIKAELETEHFGKWIVMHDRILVGVFEDFDAAAALAVERFGRGPYLIRQVGAPPMTLPASVMYRPVHGNDSLRVQR